MPVIYHHNANDNAVTIPKFDTANSFDTSYSESQLSPIDSCIEKINDLNLIHTNFSTSTTLSSDYIQTQYNLVLLGFISAIESYVREIIRKIILIDNIARKSCELQLLNYGAVLNYKRELLPEALLEKASFASKTNIIEAFKSFLDIKGHAPNELNETLEEFEKICHLRHCIVHRFGKLGSQNAIKFGLDLHSLQLEKPIKLDEPKIYDLSIICTNTVFVINNFLFNKMIIRTADNWTWDYRRDKTNFLKFFKLFHSTLRPHPLSDPKQAYKDLKIYHDAL